MAYRVEFAARAARDLEILYVEKNAAESKAAARWYNRLEEAVYALATHPQRCPIAPEARRMKRKLRHLLYSKKPDVYRVIYEIDEKQQTVWVLAIRHGARRNLGASDIEPNPPFKSPAAK
jgi:mRNA-degrading endonuclease RelE of RelBE toxin-antitoxin system